MDVLFGLRPQAVSQKHPWNHVVMGLRVRTQSPAVWSTYALRTKPCQIAFTMQRDAVRGILLRISIEMAAFSVLFSIEKGPFQSENSQYVAALQRCAGREAAPRGYCQLGD